MTKINFKYFKKITSEPIEVQSTDRGIVEIHSLNESVFYDEYISKGKFFFWCSDGETYKLVIEEGYFDELKEFFIDKVNAQWIRYYESTDQVRSKYTKKYIIPAGVVYVLLSTISVTLFQEYAMYILMGILLLVVILSKVFNNKLNNEFNLRHNEATANVKKIVGKREYKELLDKQEKYRNRFYKFDEDEEIELENQNQEQTEIQESNEEV